MQTSPQRQDVDEHGQSWELSEDSGGLLRTQDDSRNDITQVFSEDGTLLTGFGEPGVRPAEDAHAPTSAGGRLGRLLRFYMGSAGRRVVLQDAQGGRWPARITSTRWRAGGRTWSFRSSAGEPDEDK